jgi:hypothetical protein
VTLVLPSGEKLPGRVLECGRDALLVVIVVPTRRLREDEIAALVLEYPNPGGRVRLRGEAEQRSGGREGILVRISSPQLIEVVQERQHVRVAAECPLALRPTGPGEDLYTHTFDISAGGLLVARTPDMDVGERFRFRLMITPGTPPVGGALEIVRVHDIGRLGTYFTDISPSDRWRLVRFTLDCQRLESFRHPALDEGDPWADAATWHEDGEG